MNEQLIVKNFGPIKDATVDFKRVTVFIGPTGGGKSTLAKLAAISREGSLSIAKSKLYKTKIALENFGINNYMNPESNASWKNSNKIGMDFNFNEIENSNDSTDYATVSRKKLETEVENFLITKYEEISLAFANQSEEEKEDSRRRIRDKIVNGVLSSIQELAERESVYIPSERTFVAAVGYSWPGLLRDNIGLPKTILDFANSFSISRKDTNELNIPFLNARYTHREGQDYIEISGVATLFRLYETASGIQSVTPLLVLLEHLSRNTEQAQSFIIEEPELNLYPTAQQGLLNWLVEKCTKGENDLTITTHSPYILSHLNLLLYAYQVAEQHPERADEVAELVPRESWINPKEFACYQVENGGVTSLVNEDLGLIDDNGLDGLSGDAADAFDNLIRLSKGVALK